MYNNHQFQRKYNKARQDILTAIDSVTKSNADQGSFDKSLKAGQDIAKALDSISQLTTQQKNQLSFEFSATATILSLMGL